MRTVVGFKCHSEYFCASPLVLGDNASERTQVDASLLAFVHLN